MGSRNNTNHRQGFVQMDDIVRDYCSRYGSNHAHTYGRAYNFAIAGLKELNYDVMNTPKRVHLPVDTALRRVDLPEDYVNYVQIGICINGNVVALGQNPKMCKEMDDCGDYGAVNGGNVKGVTEDDDGTSEIFSDNFLITSQNRLGQFTGRVFGHGGGYNSIGYYNVDKENGWIDLSSEFSGDEIILDYISDGYEPGKTTFVHTFARETIISWIRWRMLEADLGLKPNIHAAESKARKEFFRNKRKLVNRMTSFPLYEFIAAARRSFKSTAKF